MKTTLTFALAFILTLSAFGSTNPPQHSLHATFSVTNFGSFNVHRQHNNAALSWIFDAPDASSFVIHRSYDGSNFHVVSQQAPGNGHWNKFIDTTVEPGTIFYKITAIMNDGSHQESAIEQVRIVRHR